MTAARVQILLDFFAVKTQQIGANIVDIVDIVAVLVKTVNQPGADLFPIRRLEIGFQHGHQLVKAETLLVEDHTLQGVQRIAQVSDSDTLNAGEVIARAAGGDIFAVLHAIFNERGEQRDRRPVAVADIANVAALDHQLDVMADFVADLADKAVPADVRLMFIFLQHNFHHLQQIKHGDIMQAVGAPWNRELHAADHRVISGIFQRHAAVKEGRHDHLIVENLRDAGAQADGFGSFAQERAINQLVDPHAQIRLRQLNVLIGVEA